MRCGVSWKAGRIRDGSGCKTPPASEVSGSLKKCVRTYEMLYYYCSVKVMLTGQTAGLVSPTGAGECGIRHLNVDRNHTGSARLFPFELDTSVTCPGCDMPGFP